MSTIRRTATLGALLLGATLLAPTGAANAAGETCRGEAATIVGTGTAIQGTDGRDVIVTGGSVTIVAGAGDDVVCVTGANFNVINVDAGAGNDVVDGTALSATYYLNAILGDGADSFDGGDGSDTVTSGTPGAANDDIVRTGNGDDYVTWAGTLGHAGVLDAGAGTDTLNARASGETFGVDLAAQTLTRNGAREATFRSFERLTVVAEPDVGSVEVLGTNGADVVGLDPSLTVRADLAGGDDDLTLTGTTPGSHIDLGPGTDLLHARSPKGSIELDLADPRFAVDGTASASLAGVENVDVSAPRATVVGDDQANDLRVNGCRVRVDGRGGKDVIENRNHAEFRDTCDAGGGTLRGGAGNDAISGGRFGDLIHGGGGNDKIEAGPARSGKNEVWGGAGDDKILGGRDKDVLSGGAGNDTVGGKSGRDVAIGGPDRDQCRAEIRKSCERTG